MSEKKYDKKTEMEKQRRESDWIKDLTAESKIWSSFS